MNRNSLVEMSGRVMHFATRMTLNKTQDNPLMQTIDFDGMNSDMRKAVERVQSFGMTSVPLPRDEEGQQQQSSGGTGGDGEQPKGPAAEGIALFLGGQRNHPVIIAIDDRRHRPMHLKPGESSQYDDQGQMTLLKRNGLFLVSLDSEEKGKDGKTEKKERMTSLRHVTKGKQERPKSGGAKAYGLSEEAYAAEMQAMDDRNEKFKHEGEQEKVNTEVRCTGNRIELRTGDKLVGHYDKGSNTWEIYESGGNFKVIISPNSVIGQYQDSNKSFKVDSSHTHIKYGENAIWVSSAGCFSTREIVIAPDPS